MDLNVTANLKALAQSSSTETVTLEDKVAKGKADKAKARARLNREIGKKSSFAKASIRMFVHVFIITAAILTTDWIFNSGLQTQFLYRGSASNNLITVVKNKAYHVNAFVKSNFSF